MWLPSAQTRKRAKPSAQELSSKKPCPAPVSVATGNHGYQIDGKRPPEKGSIQHLVRRCECNCFTKALVRSCSSSSASDRALLCRGSRSRLNFSNQWLEVASRTQASNRQETRTEEDLNSRGRKREWGGGRVDLEWTRVLPGLGQARRRLAELLFLLRPLRAVHPRQINCRPSGH